METRTAGAEGGPGKRAGSNPGTALRPDPYYPVKVWVNGHEWAKRQAAAAGDLLHRAVQRVRFGW